MPLMALVAKIDGAFIGNFVKLYRSYRSVLYFIFRGVVFINYSL